MPRFSFFLISPGPCPFSDRAARLPDIRNRSAKGPPLGGATARIISPTARSLPLNIKGPGTDFNIAASRADQSDSGENSYRLRRHGQKNHLDPLRQGGRFRLSLWRRLSKTHGQSGRFAANSVGHAVGRTRNNRPRGWAGHLPANEVPRCFFLPLML